jgi:CBS domain-containing protein
MSITAADVMTSPATTIEPHMGIAAAADLLARKHISALPVCDPDGRLVGLVSEADILRPFRESSRAARDWWLGSPEGQALSQAFVDYVRRDTRTVQDLMVRHVITAEEGTTLPQLAELMTKHGIKRIPILNKDFRVVGVVSRGDLVTAIARAPAMLV